MRAGDQKKAALVEHFKGRGFEPHYLGYFECFNQQLYFEAHEVLEKLWLEQRGQPIELFYKGLIQLAGAFVHLQKNRRGPAISLFGLARCNLKKYPRYHEGLDVNEILQVIARYLEDLSRPDLTEPLFCADRAPKLVPRDQSASPSSP